MKIILFSNTSWSLYNFRLALAKDLQSRAEVILLSPPDEYNPRLEAAGFRWIPFPMSRQGMNPFSELATVWRLVALYRRERPDLVHHFTIKCMIYGSLAARLAGVRGVVNTVTGLGYVFGQTDWRGRLLNSLVRAAYRFVLRGAQVIFQNPDDRAEFTRERLVDEAHATLIRGSGIDLSLYRPLPEPDGEPLVMLAARMLRDKGVGEFVEAARRLRTSGLRARFALVGDTDAGNPAAIPNGQLKAWQGEGAVEWWGWRDDMPAALAQAHIICLPSYYKEGLPRGLLEAAACARPIVTTDWPGCREAVRDGVNGFLVPPRDSSALAEALRTLIVDPALRARMGREGRRMAEEEFNIQRVNAATMDVYDKALRR
ncbi:MAG: glycosyltransferase family 4 protein [Chloroflexota bacterium]